MPPSNADIRRELEALLAEMFARINAERRAKRTTTTTPEPPKTENTK